MLKGERNAIDISTDDDVFYSLPSLFLTQWFFSLDLRFLVYSSASPHHSQFDDDVAIVFRANFAHSREANSSYG
jgi:hypothetical protein